MQLLRLFAVAQRFQTKSGEAAIATEVIKTAEMTRSCADERWSG
jgi:hypothetical protein